MDEYYEKLANAIIIRAVKDYRYALTRLKYHPLDRRWQMACDELERFFKSDWYSFLTDLDSTVIMEGVQREVKRGGTQCTQKNI